MSTSASLQSIGTVCKRYGPGRLPGAGRPDVGAGYAAASAALGVSVLYAVLATGLGVAWSSPSFDHRVLAGLALAAIPLVVPPAFLSGVAARRLLSADTPYFGAIAGFVATVGTYVGAVGALSAVLFVVALATGATDPAGEAASLAVVIGAAGFVMTAWLAIPLGGVCGVIYERVGVDTP